MTEFRIETIVWQFKKGLWVRIEEHENQFTVKEEGKAT